MEVEIELQAQLNSLLLEVQCRDFLLPYIMATFKLHKLRYHWITNAQNCIFSSIASIITHVLQLIIMEIKAGCQLRMHTYKQFSKVESCLYQVIDSLFDLTLNLPDQIFCLYIVDITCYYETIPLIGNDNFAEALNFFIKLAFRQHHTSKAVENVIWIHINTTMGKVDVAKWSNKCPSSSCWIPFSQDRFNNIQCWLINNCFVHLGSKV